MAPSITRRFESEICAGYRENRENGFNNGQYLSVEGHKLTAMKFFDAEWILHSTHLIKCRKLIPQSIVRVPSLGHSVLQTSNLRDSPHDIKRKLYSDEQIISAECSCKAG